ncbi:hypothetical protein VE03_06980 [Pseudogymnoascus sp. 23342-1-I1]|nr:hypothetical protein VE03_06980 [Pseudogymnoascus sp. 23342-1-I1]
MTYDLHGQWDYDNEWSSPSCPSGNCLRSHVNETETKDALSMITKASAPSNKVVVGVESYGRSFKMAKAGCDSESCLFTGTPRVSNAAMGRCTNTSGYISNAEIDEIISNGNVKQWKKEGSNFLVYNDTEWVAYMDEDTKTSRAAFYDSYNFAGTTDWAVDLQTFEDGSDNSDDDFEYKLDSRIGAALPDRCMEQYIVNAQVATLETGLNNYTKLINNGYDEKFKVYERYAKNQVPNQVKDIEEEYGIEQAWITFGKQQMRINTGCQYAKDYKQCVEKTYNFFYNYPIATNVSIYNPKKIIGDSFANVAELLNRFKMMKKLGDWDPLRRLSDLVDATSLPAYSTQQAITSMNEVIDIAGEIEKAQREEFILSFISGLLFFIPFVGEAAGLAGIAAARTVLRLIGVAGEAGLTIFDAVSHPENAFMSVFTFLAGAGVRRSGFRNAANSRRGITPDVYNTLGGVKTSLDKVHSLRHKICPI